MRRPRGRSRSPRPAVPRRRPPYRAGAPASAGGSPVRRVGRDEPATSASTPHPIPHAEPRPYADGHPLRGIRDACRFGRLSSTALKLPLRVSAVGRAVPAATSTRGRRIALSATAEGTSEVVHPLVGDLPGDEVTAVVIALEVDVVVPGARSLARKSWTRWSVLTLGGFS